MKAATYQNYGSPEVIQIKDLRRPPLHDKGVLVNVQAASVNAADWHLMRGAPFFVRFMTGFLKPKNPVLGADIAGRVEAIGKHVTHFQPGDNVFGDLSEYGWGGFAEYVCVPEIALALKPTNLTFEETAAVPLAAITALQGLRDHGKIQAGQKVLINGASGGVGTFAVQIAKAFGTEVTGVCSTQKMDLVHSIGADHVIDYTQEDFTQSGQQYDLILAANGYHPISDYKRALSPQGVYVVSGGSGTQLFQAIAFGGLMSQRGGRIFRSFVAKPNPADLAFLKELLETGKVVPVIDKRYPLNEVADAIRHVETGHAQGKVVITVDSQKEKETLCN